MPLRREWGYGWNEVRVGAGAGMEVGLGFQMGLVLETGLNLGW